MRPVCQAERAEAHYVPPEQRTADGLCADVSGGGSTNQANTDNMVRYLSETIHVHVIL